jgi:hypothetical protein
LNANKRARYSRHSSVIQKQNEASKKRNIEKHREWRREYEVSKRLASPQYKLSKKHRCRIWQAIKSKSSWGGQSQELLGCSYAELKAHLESKFTRGMTWGNYGSHWHVDHIKPLAAFDLSNPEEVKQATHYTNLQPLEAVLNMKKSSKTTWAY